MSTSVDHDRDVVIHNTVDVTEDTVTQSPLNASGIPWIDRAYEVLRQLRRNHGLPEITPRSRQWPHGSSDAEQASLGIWPGPDTVQVPTQRAGGTRLVRELEHNFAQGN